MRKYKQVKEKKVTFDMNEWAEVERRAAAARMKTGPKQKASVEGTVGKIATAIIARLRNNEYTSIHELKTDVAARCCFPSGETVLSEARNNQRFLRGTRSKISESGKNAPLSVLAIPSKSKV